MSYFKNFNNNFVSCFMLVTDSQRYKEFLCAGNFLKMVKTNKRQICSTPTSISPKKTRHSRTTEGTTNFSGRQMSKLGVDSYDVDSITLAKSLLGKILCRKISISGKVLKGRIVECEAYPGGNDQGSATFNGRRTNAVEQLYMKPGTAWVYMTYGMYHCINISSGDEGGGILLRAVEPLPESIDDMYEVRSMFGKKRKSQPKLSELCQGPSKLCMSFNITKSECNELDLSTNDLLWIEAGDETDDKDIVVSKRIGLSSRAGASANNLLRFFLKDCEYVSGLQRHKA